MFKRFPSYLHKPLGPMISTEFECSFSRDAIVSPPIIMTSEFTSFSIGHIFIILKIEVTVLKMIHHYQKF